MIAKAKSTTAITAIVSNMFNKAPRRLPTLEIRVNPIIAYAAKIQARYNETLLSQNLWLIMTPPY